MTVSSNRSVRGPVAFCRLSHVGLFAGSSNSSGPRADLMPRSAENTWPSGVCQLGDIGAVSAVPSVRPSGHHGDSRRISCSRRHESPRTARPPKATPRVFVFALVRPIQKARAFQEWRKERPRFFTSAPKTMHPQFVHEKLTVRYDLP
jgi:hypothetical protein